MKQKIKEITHFHVYCTSVHYSYENNECLLVLCRTASTKGSLYMLREIVTKQRGKVLDGNIGQNRRGGGLGEGLSH